ncbi:glycosyltransferase family 4 protein [Nitriliruptoraceae bacterium ZYF776]|nr:glycosyltransferase family 4 protein [Profundirhabdus halotolerans]
MPGRGARHRHRRRPVRTAPLRPRGRPRRGTGPRAHRHVRPQPPDPGERRAAPPPRPGAPRCPHVAPRPAGADVVKVLHVIGDSEFGGGSRVILAVAAGARDAGHEVEVLTTDARFQEALEARGIRVVDRDWVRRQPHPVRDARGVAALTRYLRQGRHDLVHTHTTRGGVLGRLAGHRAGTPIVVHTAHGFAVAERDARWKQRAVFAVERVAARWCDHVVAVSHHHARWAADEGVRPRGSLRVIPNGVPAPAPAGPLPLPGRRGPIVVHVGRIAPGKGVDVLLDAFTDLRRGDGQGADAHLVVAGDGPAMPALTEQARLLGLGDDVTWLGHRDDVPAVLAAADVVVLPSLREGLSLALLEAMAAARAIVATDLGGTAEALVGGRAGVLVPPGDAGAVTAALRELLADPDRRTRLAARALAEFEARYRLERMVGAYRDLYAELGAATPGAGRLGAATRRSASR